MPISKAQSIIQDYEFHTMLLHRYVDDVTHEESLYQLPFEHNCMNWIFGHIVTNRSHVLETVQVPHAWELEVRALYHTETPPIGPESNSVQFGTLVKYLDESVALLKFALKDMSEDQLEETHSNYRGEKTRYAHLTGFHWHESVHLGQVEILKAFIVSSRR